MTLAKVQFLQTTDKRGRGIRVTLVWNRDRYSHTVAIVDAERLVPLLATDDGGDELEWPFSPPVQQLLFEQRADDRRIALGVGMAGRSHWSLSIEPAAGELGFLFDIACRAAAKPEFLGTCYRSQVPAEIAPDGRSARIEIGPSRVIVSTVLLADHSPSVIEETPAGFSIEPRIANPRAIATLRWQYTLRLVEKPG